MKPFPATCLALAIWIPATTLAADPPAFKKGMWEYQRTMFGAGAGGMNAESTNKKCADPAAGMKAMSDMLAKQGCKVSPPVVKGNVRTAVTECSVQGSVVRSESVMTISSDSAYSVSITTTGGGQTSREKMTAKRVGDC
jgi:hypothetical protein